MPVVVRGEVPYGAGEQGVWVRERGVWVRGVQGSHERLAPVEGLLHGAQLAHKVDIAEHCSRCWVVQGGLQGESTDFIKLHTGTVKRLNRVFQRENLK